MGVFPCSDLMWVMKWSGVEYALHFVLMPRPNQAGSLQGSSHVSGNILAADDLENGSGWQQSKQNWALPAVVG